MQDGITREDDEEAAVAARADWPMLGSVMQDDGVPLIVTDPHTYILGPNEYWMDTTGMGPHFINEHELNAVTTSGGDGGRGGAAPPGVGSSS